MLYSGGGIDNIMPSSDIDKIKKDAQKRLEEMRKKALADIKKVK